MVLLGSAKIASDRSWPTLRDVDVEGRRELDVADVVAAQVDVHQARDELVRAGVLVVLDALHEGRGAVAHADDGDVDGVAHGQISSRVRCTLHKVVSCFYTKHAISVKSRSDEPPPGRIRCASPPASARRSARPRRPAPRARPRRRARRVGARGRRGGRPLGPQPAAPGPAGRPGRVPRRPGRGHRRRAPRPPHLLARRPRRAGARGHGRRLHDRLPAAGRSTSRPTAAARWGRCSPRRPPGSRAPIASAGARAHGPARPSVVHAARRGRAHPRAPRPRA